MGARPQLARLGWGLRCLLQRVGIGVVRGCVLCDALQSPPAGCCQQRGLVPAGWLRRLARYTCFHRSAQCLLRLNKHNGTHSNYFF